MRFFPNITLICISLFLPFLAGPAYSLENLKIVVGGDHENPPYEFIKDGKATGFNVELMQAVADVTGLKVEFRLGPWGEVRKELEEGKIDALAGMYYSEERSRLVDFSVPHTMVSAGLFVRDDSPLRSLDDIRGKEVIVQKGDVIDDYLREKGITSRIIEVKNPVDVLRLLASGRHDCALMPSRFQGEYLEKALGMSGVKGMSTGLPQFRYCFAVRKGNGPLRYRLDEGLNILKVNGKYQAIYNKWFGVYEKGRLWRTVRYFAWALAVIAGLLAASAIWSWFLRREVRKRTLELREREASLRFTQFAIENAADQAFWMTEGGHIFYVNEAACRSLGYTREELQKMSIPDIDPIYQPDRFAEHWRDLQENGYATFETLHRAKDGRVYPVEIRANFVVFDGREFNCAFATDISERKRVEEELRQAYDNLEKRVEERTAELARTTEALIAAEQEKSLFLNVTDALVLYYDTEMKIHWANRAACDSVKMTHEELQQRYCWEIWHQRQEPCPGCPVLLAGETGEPQEAEMHSPDGRVWFIHVYPVKDETDRLIGMMEFCQDITERKRAEETLRLSQFCIDKAGIGIFQSDEKGVIFNVNEHACKNLGYSREELCALSLFDIDPEITPERMLELKKIIDERGSTTHYTTHKRRDGSTFPVEITANHLDFQGKRYGISFVKDITRRKKLEEELLLSHFCIDNAAIGIFQISPDDGKILRVNDFACTSLGLTRDELCSMKVFDFDPSITLEGFLAIINTMKKSGSTTFETVHKKRDGSIFPVEITANLLEFHGVSTILSFARDITERKRAEEALRESELRVRRKLESILDPGGDIGELELADILDTQQIQALMDDLHRNTSLKMSIIDLKGKVLVDVGWQEICREYHRKHPETLQRCFESDTILTEGVPRGEFKTYRCRNNMWHLVTPIFVGERQMGNLFMGQFFFENEEPEYDLFRAQARQYGFPEEKYIAALEKVPRHSEDYVNNGKSFFLRLVDMLSRLSYGNIKLARLLTERDLLAAKLQEANKVVENSPVVLFRWGGDDEWPVELVSSNIVQFGYEQEEFLSGSITYSSIIHPDDLDRVTREVHSACEGGRELLRLEYRVMTKWGGVRWVNELTNVERDNTGCIRNYEGVVIDVTDRKLAEDKLKEANLVVEHSPVVLFRCKAAPGWPVEMVSNNVVQFGYTPEEFLSGEISYSSIVYQRDLEKLTMETEEFSAAGKDKWFQEYRIVTKDGDIRWVIDQTVCERDGTGGITHYEGVIIDVTERRKAEEQLISQQYQLRDLNRTLEDRVRDEVSKNREKDVILIQQNRQAALGEILDHVAHQWKQPLYSISLITYLLKDNEALNVEEVNDTADKILSQVDHMSQTLNLFRDFYRQDKEKSVFLIKESIDQALSFMMTALLFESIKIEVDVDPKLAALGYPKEFIQVILNLLGNARDAFRERKVDKPKLLINGGGEDNQVVITVTDNAGGIHDIPIADIFRLNFTTKESSGGTGIGLFMSRNIIEQRMGGLLTAENLGDGARFIIKLDRADSTGGDKA